jgi:ATP-binding cassette subfamily B protein
MVQLIPRLYDVKSGAVYVGGDNVKDIDLKTLRSGVAMVLQKNLLFSGTIRANMQWGKEDATDEEIWSALRLAQADSFVRALPGGLDYVIEQGGSNVSGGQKQRLCIARALLTSPKILILDDSTSAVDTATEASIRKGFKEFMPSVTKLIIAQRISSVKDADRIIVIDDGEISGIGTHDELMASNRIYQEVYESQTKGGDFDEPQAD